MAQISKKKVAGFFKKATDATTTTEQGRALEDLVTYLFEKVPGGSVPLRNVMNAFGSEEVDVAVWNDQRDDGLYFLPYLFLVECKNWSSPVGSDQVAWFDRKLSDRCVDFGILVAANGITGNPERLTAAHSIIAGALRERRRIVVITRSDIEALADTGDLIRLLQERLCMLAVRGTMHPGP